MAENITSFYDLYNRANDAGKATDIQSDDLFVMQRGTGSNRNKCIKGSDMKLSSALVIAAAGDTVPGNLINKLDNSGDIAFDDFNAAGGKKIKAELKTNVVDADHLKSNSVTTAKIAEGAVTESKIALNSIQEQAIKDGAVTTSKIADNAVDKNKIAAGAVFGAALNTFIVHKNESVQVAGEATKTKVCDFVAVNKMGVIDVTVETDYSGAGNVPSGVTLSIEDTSGHELVSWSVNGGGSIAGKFTKRLVAKQSNSIPDAQMLSLYVSNGSISYGWTLGVVADGIIIY